MSIINELDCRAVQLEQNIAFELKIERLRKNYTLKYVSDSLQMSKSYLSQIENKKRTKVSMQTFIRLSLFYEVEFSDIVTRASNIN